MIFILTSIALATLLGLIIFQLALIFGAPLGKYAWGGANTYLPTRLRIASSISIILYLIFAAFISTKAGIIDLISSGQILDVGMWVLTAYFIIGIGMNAISRSKPERNTMTPIAAILAISFFIVTIS